MYPVQISNLISDVWQDINEPGLLWEVITVITCVALGSALTRALRAIVRAAVGVPQSEALGAGPLDRLGTQSFARVLSPMLGLGLLSVAKPILAHSHHVNVLRMAIPLLGSLVATRMVFYVLRRIFARAGQVGALVLLSEKLIAVLVWCGVALYVTGQWTDLIGWLETTVIPLGQHRISILEMMQVACSIAITMMLALWAGASLEDRLMAQEGVHSSLRVVVARLGRAMLILIALLVSLTLAGIDLTVLSVFGGALGVGLGLGLQKLVSSYVSGFVVLIERSIAIGDLITIDKYTGIVSQIKTRYTILRGLDGLESVIPNEMLVSTPVQNYVLTDRTLRVAVQVTVDYANDVEQVLSLLSNVPVGIPRVAVDPAPQSYLVRFGADGYDLELGFWISDPENGRLGVMSDVNRAICRCFKENNIRIPSPQREVRLIQN